MPYPNDTDPEVIAETETSPEGSGELVPPTMAPHRDRWWARAWMWLTDTVHRHRHHYVITGAYQFHPVSGPLTESRMPQTVVYLQCWCHRPGQLTHMIVPGSVTAEQLRAGQDAAIQMVAGGSLPIAIPDVPRPWQGMWSVIRDAISGACSHWGVVVDDVQLDRITAEVTTELEATGRL